jgi:hypothetical protein
MKGKHMGRPEGSKDKNARCRECKKYIGLERYCNRRFCNGKCVRKYYKKRYGKEITNYQREYHNRRYHEDRKFRTRVNKNSAEYIKNLRNFKNKHINLWRSYIYEKN